MKNVDVYTILMEKVGKKRFPISFPKAKLKIQKKTKYDNEHRNKKNTPTQL